MEWEKETDIHFLKLRIKLCSSVLVAAVALRLFKNRKVITEAPLRLKSFNLTYCIESYDFTFRLAAVSLPSVTLIYISISKLR